MPSVVTAVFPYGFPANHIAFLPVRYGFGRIEFPSVKHIVFSRHPPGTIKAVSDTISGLPPAGIIGKGQIPFIPHTETVMALMSNKGPGRIERLVMLPVSYILRYVNSGAASPKICPFLLGCRNQHTEFPQLFVPNHMRIPPVKVSVIFGIGSEEKFLILFPMLQISACRP